MGMKAIGDRRRELDTRVRAPFLSPAGGGLRGWMLFTSTVDRRMAISTGQWKKIKNLHLRRFAPPPPAGDRELKA